MAADRVCYNCGKKVGLMFSKKCQDQFFCLTCVGKLHSYIVDDFDIFTPDQVSDLIVVSEAKDKMYQNEALRKILSDRAKYVGWKRADESDRRKLEAEYKRERDSINREMERDLKEVEREYIEFKKSNHNHVTEAQQATVESMKQTIRENYQKDIKKLEEDFELDKAGLDQIAKKGSNKREINENELNLILWKTHNRARELKQQKIAEAEEQKKIEMQKREEEQRANEKQKIDKEVRTVAQKQVEAELEQYKIEAQEKALKEIKEKERIKAENEAKRNLEKELHKQRMEELKQARRADPVYLAWISLGCSIMAWITLVTGFLPIIFIPAALITGIKALKTSKKNVAIASIITTGVLVLILIAFGILGSILA